MLWWAFLFYGDFGKELYLDHYMLWLNISASTIEASITSVDIVPTTQVETFFFLLLDLIGVRLDVFI